VQQKDLKRVFAYSSVNHLGYCLLGIFALAVPIAAGDAGAHASQDAALNGVILQMFNHGLTAAALFWFVAILQVRTGGHRGIDDFGGLRKPAPVLAGLMGIALFSSLGLPGLNGFVGEFLIFRGVFPLAWVAATVSILGLLVTAAVILTVIQKVFSGPTPEHCASFPDLDHGERFALAPVIGLMFLLGIVPQLIVDSVNPTVENLLKHWRF
jgi:NADH-quinone oxidoreductase subunit M